MAERPVQGTPYGDLWWGLWDNYTDVEKHAIIDRFKAAHAHELAEQIRNSEWLRDYTDDHMGDCNAAADVIDLGTEEPS